MGSRITPWVSLPRRSASTIRAATSWASPAGRPTASNARRTNAVSACAPMRGICVAVADACATLAAAMSLPLSHRSSWPGVTSAAARMSRLRYPGTGATRTLVPYPLKATYNSVPASGACVAHALIPRHRRYRRDILGFCLSQRGNRRAHHRQAALHARRSLARDSRGHRDVDGPRRARPRYRLFLSRHDGRHQRFARGEGGADRTSGDGGIPLHLSRGGPPPPLRRRVL